MLTSRYLQILRGDTVNRSFLLPIFRTSFNFRMISTKDKTTNKNKNLKSQPLGDKNDDIIEVEKN